jgi:hypothetical protein
LGLCRDLEVSIAEAITGRPGLAWAQPQPEELKIASTIASLPGRCRSGPGWRNTFRDPGKTFLKVALAHAERTEQPELRAA